MRLMQRLPRRVELAILYCLHGFLPLLLLGSQITPIMRRGELSSPRWCYPVILPWSRANRQRGARHLRSTVLIVPIVPA